MASSLTLGRAQLIFALCMPLAILLGYLLSDPLDPGTGLFVMLALGILSIPLLMYGYHPALIFSWNAVITPAFLPGQAYLWVPLAVLGVGFATVNRFTSANVRSISIPSLTRPLLFLFVVVAATAYFHGGFGLHSFGSATYGGRNYVYIFAAILGYFALSSQRILLHRAKFYTALFFLTGLTALIPNLAFAGGTSWYFLYYIFPPVFAVEQALETNTLNVDFVRVLGLTSSSIALLCWLLARYGFRGIFSLRNPWPMFLFLVASIACAFTGFRSMLVVFSLTLAAQFWFEGLFRWKTVAPMLALLFLIAAVVLPNAEELPMVIQRTMSVLPVRLNPVVEMAARGSSEWRVQMWKELLPEIPKYLLAGKGFGIDPTDLAFAQSSAQFGYGYSGSMVAGDYHSGPLSIVIPLGIWGVIGFSWFCIASIKYLYRQHKYGDPDLRTINTFLLAYFIARLIMFIFVFGGFFSDLFMFTGIVGFSVSLNGATLPQPEAAATAGQAQAEALAGRERALLATIP